MVYGLFRVLPGARALWSPSPVELLPRTWRQRRGVRTTRLRRPHPAPSSEAFLASTASRPALVTIAKRPSSGTGRPTDTTDLGRPASAFSEIRKQAEMSCRRMAYPCLYGDRLDIPATPQAAIAAINSEIST